MELLGYPSIKNKIHKYIIMANNCSNSNTNSCSPCTGCEDIVSSDCVSVLSSISCINMSSGDNLTDVLNALGSAVCNFYSLIDAGNGLTVSEVDGSPSYAATNLLRFNQDSGFIVTQPSANTADVRLIPVFLFPDGLYITVDAVTTANITLSGAQTIDTIVGVAGTTRVLVWKQTIKTQNGVYLMQAGAWTRATDSDTTEELNNQVVFANYTKTGTQYGNKYFNQIAVSPVIGADNIIYQVGTGNVNNKWTKGGDTVEQEESIGTIDNFDFPTKTYDIENTRVFKTGQYGVGISASPLARVHIVGQNSAVLDQSTFYAEDYAQTNSFEIRRNGDIYRDHDLYSLARNVDGNTSWGESALDNIDLTLAHRNTAVGKIALEDLVDGWDNTAVGWWAGGEAIGDDCVYIGVRAGLNSIGDQNTFIGSRTDSNGIWSNSIALGYEAEIYGNNQFIIGSADAPIVNVYIGEGYRSSTPGSVALRGTQGNGSNISASDFIIVPGAGTGTGTPGDFIVHKAPAGASGSGINASSETFKIKGTNGDIYRNGVYYSTISTLNNTWGYNAGAAITTGYYNLIHGNYCGTLVADGISNIIIGSIGGSGAAGAALVSGIENTITGSGSGYQLTSSRNTLYGYTTGYGITTGENNHIFGHRVGRGLSGSSTSGVTTGSYNVLIGNGDTARHVGSGTYNTFVGVGGGGFIQNSFATTTLGAYSGFRTAAGTVSSSLYLGHACIAQSSYECVLGGWLAANIYLGAGQFAGNEGSGTKLIDINMQPHSVANSCAYTGFADVTDGDGIDWYQSVSQATGDGDSGDIIWRYAPPGSTGTTLTTLANGLTFKGTNGGLELSSTLGYLLLNRLTTAQKNALTAVNGMVVYDSTLNKFQGYENGAWTSFI